MFEIDEVTSDAFFECVQEDFDKMTATTRETRGKAKQEELAHEHEHEAKKQKVETRGRSTKPSAKKQEKDEMDVDKVNGAPLEEIVDQFEEFVEELEEHTSLEDLKLIADENHITPDLFPKTLLLGL